MHTHAHARLARLALAVTVLVGFAADASAQTNAFGYEQNAATYDLVAPPAGSGNALLDDGVAVFTLPWSFPWYGASYGTVYAGDNGELSFTAKSISEYANGCFPDTFGVVDVAVFWDDLEAGAGFAAPGDVHIWHDQLGGNDRVIVHWEQMPLYSSFTGDTGTFQVHLYPTGEVQLHWQDTLFGDPFADNGASATIGIQDDAGGTYDPLEVTCDAALTLQNTAISFSTCSDGDSDGYQDAACGGDDCDDADPNINPAAVETCDNAVDEDCSGAADVSDGDSDTYINEACPGGDDCDDADPGLNPGVDADGDGSNACLDCNDTPGLGAFLYPGNTEVCGDGIDQDCSGSDDQPDADADGYTATACGGDDCDDTNPQVNPGTDLDNDTFSVCDGDCDDLAPSAFPGNPEICDNGIDNDCDGTADDIDADGDGDLAIPCGGTDCDDNDPTVGATTDADSDGSNACDDCDDTDPNVFPGAPELCDTTDSDCDGLDDAFDLDVNSGGTSTVTGASTLQGFIAGFTSLPATVSVGTPGTIVDLNVTLGISYVPMNEVTLTLASPLGTTITLVTGASGSNMTSTLLDDEASSPLSSGTGPYTGSFQPSNPLSAFDGEDAAGTWTVSGTTSNFAGFGTIDSVTLTITIGAVDDSDGDGAVDSCGDCDDTLASVYPGAPETCGDGIDQDCDGVDATGDLDSDGYVDADCGGDDCDDGDPNINPSVDGDGDGSNVCDDCDDGDAANFPGNLEICADGIDQDCSGADDSGDADNDGFINDACIGGDDCDDTNAAVFPGAFDQDGDGYDVCEDCYDLAGDTEALVNPDEPEVCDGLDNNCDGTTDNQDLDEDGYVSDECFGGTDCDDDDPAINPQTDQDGDGFNACVDCDDDADGVFPGATEICGDAIDQNCNGSDLVGDVDGDGYDSLLCGGDDCDDADPNANPAGTDICDGVDLDCDGVTVAVDEDGDGFFDAKCGGDDCDDGAIAIHPDAAEVCDGIDNNCDGALLDGGEDDQDEDGVPICADDCDDTDPGQYPGAEELCDGLDNDCDDEVDEGLITDGDQDGFIRQACGGDDCDDSEANVYPGATEDCSDGADNDCDGSTDGEDEDCDFANNGCACSAGASDRAPGGLAFVALLGLVAAVRRRRAWSAS
jgi:MYXO-CTERM domain-containing protein